MKLVAVTVTNYRSITSAHKIKLTGSTVLVGPNNEGKSNFLKAIVIAMRVLTSAQRVWLGNNRFQTRFTSNGGYRWNNDYPIPLQSKTPDGSSVFELDFELTDAEVADFEKEIASTLNGTLPIRVEMGKENVPMVSVRKKGRGGAALTKKSPRISLFLAKRIEFLHVPAVRTAKHAQSVVDQMVERELEALENSDDYKKALKVITDLQEPVLTKLSSDVKSTMVAFLPSIKNVKFQIAAAQRFRALRRTRMIVDDGIPTDLEHKGDGVQSVAAIALMRYSSESSSSSKQLIIAVEEPESHLHSQAMHGLRSVLRELAAKSQLVLTTHSALFINRSDVQSNVIVNKSKALPAKSVQQIRDILGIRASDNLRHAELVLVVEGEDDRRSLTALFGTVDGLSSVLDDGTLAIDSLGGGTNLTYKLGELRNAICPYHCFLDHDAAGLTGFAKAQGEGLCELADVNFSVCNGMPESELEDMYEVALYSGLVLNKYGVSLQDPKFSGNKKWSVRVSETFKHQGKSWNEKLLFEIKFGVSELVQQNPTAALNSHKRSSFDSLVTALKAKLHK